MTLHDQLLGQWSAYAYDGYGTMEDERLVFRPDQSGWYTFERGFLCERITFVWSLSPANLLTLVCREHARIGVSRGTVVVKSADCLPEVLAITIREEPVHWPGEAVMVVLAFAQAPFAGTVNFAQIAPDGMSIPFPRFEGETDTAQ